MITSISEQKDEALKLIDAILSKENTNKMEALYMNPEFKTKNIDAVIRPKPSLYVTGEFNMQGNAVFNRKIREMNKDGKDINTSLREMQEELQK